MNGRLVLGPRLAIAMAARRQAHVTTALTSHDPCTLPAPLRNPLTIVPPGLVRHYSKEGLHIEAAPQGLWSGVIVPGQHPLSSLCQGSDRNMSARGSRWVQRRSGVRASPYGANPERRIASQPIASAAKAISAFVTSK